MNRDDFYLCACSDTGRGGIYRFRNISGEKPKQMDFNALPGTNFLCFSPDRAFLFATWNTPEEGGGAASFRIQPDGSLVFLNRLPSGGKSACHMTCSPDGKFLYCANYSSGNFAEFAIAPDGSLQSRTKLIQHEGPCGPRKDRQECPHTHCTNFTPDGKFLCVVDLGIDAVKLYPFGKDGISTDSLEWKAAPGDGPRHILFDRAGTTAYIINELGNSVTTLTYASGKLQKTAVFGTLPDGCTETTKASAVRLSPDEKFLYASNRGFDSIACFRVKEPGKLEIFDIVSSFGKSPRDINYLPGFAAFAAANEFSDNVGFYDVNPENGVLSYREGCDLCDLPRPLYILF